MKIILENQDYNLSKIEKIICEIETQTSISLNQIITKFKKQLKSYYPQSTFQISIRFNYFVEITENHNKNEIIYAKIIFKP